MEYVEKGDAIRAADDRLAVDCDKNQNSKKSKPAHVAARTLSGVAEARSADGQSSKVQKSSNGDGAREGGVTRLTPSVFARTWITGCKRQSGKSSPGTAGRSGCSPPAAVIASKLRRPSCARSRSLSTARRRCAVPTALPYSTHSSAAAGPLTPCKRPNDFWLDRVFYLFVTDPMLTGQG
jgi:hypothetical protein